MGKRFNHFRDAVTGRFVDKEEATRRPRETVEETVSDEGSKFTIQHLEIAIERDTASLEYLSRLYYCGEREFVTKVQRGGIDIEPFIRYAVDKMRADKRRNGQ